MPPATVEPENEFKLLDHNAVHAALGERGRANPVACEVDRLVADYCLCFTGGFAAKRYPVSAFLSLKPRWPIEAIAIQRARTILAQALAPSTSK